MTTRRARFGAGALALLAGCGAPEEVKVDSAAVLGEQLRAAQAVANAYASVPGQGRANAEKRVELLEAALRDAGGTPAAAPAQGAAGVTAALDAETAALRAHVAAIGELDRDEYRELFSSLIVDAAAGESRLLALLDRPPLPTAFPGQPV
jgi:hypothetical protein